MSYLISLHLFSPFQLNHAPYPSKWIIITYSRQSTLFLNLFIYFFRSKGVSREVRGKRAFPALRTQTERVQFSWLSRIQSTAQKVGLHLPPFPPLLFLSWSIFLSVPFVLFNPFVDVWRGYSDIRSTLSFHQHIVHTCFIV